MRLSEIWQKGHPTKNQTLRLVSNALGNAADVSLDGDNIVVEMYWHAFIDKFTYPGMTDKLLTMDAKLEKIKHLRLQSSTPAGYQSYEAEYKELNTKLYRYFQKVKTDAINKARSFVPRGWLLTGNLDVSYVAAANAKLKLKIIRDHNAVVDNNKVYFHITKKKNLSNIMHNGLRPGTNTRVGADGYRDRVYLFQEDPTKVAQGMILPLVTGAATFATNAQMSTEVIVFKVKLNQDAKVYEDPEAPGVAVYTENHIPVNDLEIIYQGPISELV